MTSKEWKKCKLGDIADVTKLAGFEFTKYINYDESGEIIALRALNLRNGILDLSDIKRIKKSVSDSLTRSKLYINDILLTYTGNGYGDCAIIKENDKYHLAPNICKISPKIEIVDPYYLYSYIRSKQFYTQMTNNMVGSGQPTIPMKTIRILEIPISSKNKQQKIAKVLSAIDDKIELNNSINNNLEQQAQAIFKQIFSDISEDDLPSNWHKGTIGEIIELHDSKRVPLSGQQREKMKQKIYPYYGATSLMDYVDDYIFDGIYLLLGEDGTVIDTKGFPILQYVWGKFWVNNHAHILTGKNGFNVESLYLLFRQLSIKSIVTGAVQAKISQTNLKSLEVIIPPIEVIENLNDKIKPLFYQIRSNLDENKVLTQLRDTILPKLMTGEIDVSEVDISTDKLLFSEDINND